MADYQTILTKAISGLSENTAERRQVIYAKARSTIEQKLRAMDPAPSQAAIDAQLAKLDESIASVEDRYATVEAEQASAAATPVNPESETANIEASASQDNAQPVDADGPALDANTPSPSLPQGEETVVEEPSQKDGSEPDPLPTGSEPWTDSPNFSEQTKQPGSLPEMPGLPMAEPESLDYSQTVLADEDQPNSIEGAKEKRGIIGGLLPILLAFLVVGGGTYALWLNKDSLLSAFLSDDNPTVNEEPIPDEKDKPAELANQTEPEEKPANNVRIVGEEPVATRDPDAGKEEEKLTAEGETVTAEPVKEEPVTLPDNQPDTDAGEVVQTQPAVEEPEPDTEVADADKPTVSEVGQPNTTENKPVDDGNASSDALAVSQTAFLYEEGNGSESGTRDNAAILWSLVNEKLASGKTEAVIRGVLDVPGRGLKMELSIRRNQDASLPASHIVELNFTPTSEFDGGNVGDVARMVLKSSQNARGESLIAVPAKIADGHFLIALNNLDQALKTNKTLLLEKSWIDIIIRYVSGRRALVVLEKGAIGDKVFKDAFASWD